MKLALSIATVVWSLVGFNLLAATGTGIGLGQDEYGFTNGKPNQGQSHSFAFGSTKESTPFQAMKDSYLVFEVAQAAEGQSIQMKVFNAQSTDFATYSGSAEGVQTTGVNTGIDGNKGSINANNGYTLDTKFSNGDVFGIAVSMDNGETWISASDDSPKKPGNSYTGWILETSQSDKFASTLVFYNNGNAIINVSGSGSSVTPAGSGAPLPGVLASLLVAGATGLYAKRKKQK